MARYPNGQIPARLLVEVGPYQWLTKATAQRWKNLVDDILRNEGVKMRITPGKNGYRDREGQEFARKNACARGRCNDAAVPGTSSHGGEYRGRDSMAIDVQNWGVLGKDKWYAYCRKHGFEPGFFDWEPWHIIDWNPWVMPATAGGNSTKPSLIGEEIEDDMRLYYVTDRYDGKTKKPGWVILNLRTGKLVPPMINNGSKLNQERANGWARTLGTAKNVVWQDILNMQEAIRLTS